MCEYAIFHLLFKCCHFLKSILPLICIFHYFQSFISQMTFHIFIEIISNFWHILSRASNANLVCSTISPHYLIILNMDMCPTKVEQQWKDPKILMQYYYLLDLYNYIIKNLNLIQVSKYMNIMYKFGSWESSLSVTNLFHCHKIIFFIFSKNFFFLLKTGKVTNWALTAVPVKTQPTGPAQ